MAAHGPPFPRPRRGIGVVAALCAAVAVSWAPADAATVKGIVTDDDGRALSGVSVMLRSGDATSIIERSTTGEDGVFTLDADQVRPGREVVLELRGYEDVVLDIGPQHLVVATLELTMKRAVTVDPTGAPPALTDEPATPRYAPVSEQRTRAIEIYNDAVKQYEKATKEKVDEDKADAIQMLREAASIDPTFAEPHRLLARLALKQQNWAEAARYAEDLLRIDPDDTEAVRILYLGMIVSRNHFRVGEAARRLAAADPSAVDSIEEHARTFYENGVHIMSRELYEVLIDVTDDPATAYLNLGICNLALGDTEAVRTAFESFLELAPEDHPDLEMVREQLAGLQ